MVITRSCVIFSQYYELNYDIIFSTFFIVDDESRETNTIFKCQCSLLIKNFKNQNW